MDHQPHIVVVEDEAARRAMEAFDRAIDLRITRLRRTIEVDPAHPDSIRTVRGVG